LAARTSEFVPSSSPFELTVDHEVPIDTNTTEDFWEVGDVVARVLNGV